MLHRFRLTRTSTGPLVFSAALNQPNGHLRRDEFDKSNLSAFHLNCREVRSTSRHRHLFGERYRLRIHPVNVAGDFMKIVQS